MANNTTKFATLLYNWLNDNVCNAYRGVLPSGEDPEGEYIIFSPYVSNFAEQFIQPVIIYSQSTSSYEGVMSIADKIDTLVGEGGIIIGDADMRVVIYKGSPFYQDNPEQNENIKSGYINLLMTIYQKVR